MYVKATLLQVLKFIKRCRGWIAYECIRVVSYPGPDSSILLENVKSGSMVARRYRNRRIGEFLKELDFTEGRGTGVPKMKWALEANGSPKPQFFTDEGRTFFYTEIAIHPEFLKDITPKETHGRVHDGVYDGVYDQSPLFLSETEARIVNLMKNQPIGLSRILADFGYKVVTRNIRDALTRLLKQSLIAYTIPDKPRSKHQQYKITVKGKQITEQK